MAVLAMLGTAAISQGAAVTNDVSQQAIFVSGQNGYHTCRIPALMVTRRGTLLAFCEGRKNRASDTGDIDLLLRRSTDGGKSWSPQQVVWNDAENTCGNPCPVVDETSGTVWLLLTHNPGDTAEKQIKERKTPGTRTVWVSGSEDDGVTWSPPTNITATTKDPEWGWYATGPGVGIQLAHGPHRGRLIIPCDHSYDIEAKNTPGKRIEGGSHIIYSDDHGKSWKLGGTVRPNMNECQAVELADGKGGLLINMRTYSAQNCRGQSVSRDGGITWTAPEPALQLVEPRCQASLLRYDWPVGKSAGHVLFSNPAGPRRTRMTVRLSTDDAQTWSSAKVLHDGPAAYSCLAVLPDKTIGCLYECGEKNAYERIVFATFALQAVKQ